MEDRFGISSDWRKVYDVTLIPGLAYTLSALVFELPEPPEIIMTITLRRQATIDTFLESIGAFRLYKPDSF